MNTCLVSVERVPFISLHEKLECMTFANIMFPSSSPALDLNASNACGDHFSAVSIREEDCLVTQSSSSVKQAGLPG